MNGSGAVGYTETINQPSKIRLADGSEVAITDWSWQMLYSVVDVLSGATDEELYTFNYVESDPVSHSSNITGNQLRNATKKDCNNTGKSQMPSEEEFICYSVAILPMQFEYDANASGELAYVPLLPGGPMPTASNLNYAMSKLVFAMEITDKDFFTGDLSWFGRGGGAFVTSSGGAAGNLRTYATNGLPSKDSIDRAPVPLHIGGTEEFKGIFYNPDGLPINWMLEDGTVSQTIVMRFKTELIGLRKRPAA